MRCGHPREAEICPECGIRQRDPPRSGTDAAVEQLTQGRNRSYRQSSRRSSRLGRIYNRELGKGLALILASIFVLFSAVVLIGVVLYAIVWLHAIYDAYTVAERQSGLAEEPSPNG